MYGYVWIMDEYLYVYVCIWIDSYKMNLVTLPLNAFLLCQVYLSIGQSNLASKTALMLRELPFGWAICRWTYLINKEHKRT